MQKKDYTLAEMKRSIPKGGLLNPGLRKGFGKVPTKADAFKPPKQGNFSNVLKRK